MDTHGHSPRGPKSPKQSTGRASVLSPRTNVLICVLMDSHGRPVCADRHTQTHTDVLCPRTSCVFWRTPTDTHGHTRTATDVLCVLTDSHRQPHTSCVCWRTPADVLCVLNRQPTWAKITQTSPGRASVLSPRTNVLICVLMDSHRRPVCADGHTRTDTNTHGQPRMSCVCWRTPTDVLCVLNRQPTWAKITRTVHGKGQRADSKDQRADMCTDGQPQSSSTDVMCVLTDTHGRPVCADRHPRTQPTRAKITQTVHGKGQRAESKDQRADICTDGQPRTSYSPRGPKSPEQSTGRASSTGRVSVLSPRTNVLISVLMDSHGRPVCADGHTQTHTDSHGHPVVQPMWAKITQTVHGKGQRAESKDQRSDMCTDGQPRTSCTHTHVLCVLTDTHRRPVCADGQPLTATNPLTSCVSWRTPTDILCVLNRKPTWAKITQTVHGKGQHAESKDQCADMCTDGQPRTSCTHTDVLCVLMDTHRRPVCADRQQWTATNILCTLADTHG
ncbi:unnamed protein product, partial [Brassica rapa]